MLEVQGGGLLKFVVSFVLQFRTAGLKVHPCTCTCSCFAPDPPMHGASSKDCWSTASLKPDAGGGICIMVQVDCSVSHRVCLPRLEVVVIEEVRHCRPSLSNSLAGGKLMQMQRRSSAEYIMPTHFTVPQDMSSTTSPDRLSCQHKGCGGSDHLHTSCYRRLCS
jgi:hypothetical protein